MDEFVTTSAFRTKDADRVLEAITDFLSASDSPGTVVDGDEEVFPDDREELDSPWVFADF